MEVLVLRDTWSIHQNTSTFDCMFLDVATSAPCLLAMKWARNHNPFYILWWKWNLEDAHKKPVLQMKWAGYERDGGWLKSVHISCQQREKGWARGRQMYLVSSQTLGRRWWSARGSWQVLNLSLLSFRRRGCDTGARKGWKQLVRDKWVTIRTQQMEAQTWKINCGDQTRVASILTAPVPKDIFLSVGSHGDVCGESLKHVLCTIFLVKVILEKSQKMPAVFIWLIYLFSTQSSISPQIWLKTVSHGKLNLTVARLDAGGKARINVCAV